MSRKLLAESEITISTFLLSAFGIKPSFRSLVASTLHEKRHPEIEVYGYQQRNVAGHSLLLDPPQYPNGRVPRCSTLEDRI